MIELFFQWWTYMKSMNSGARFGISTHLSKKFATLLYLYYLNSSETRLPYVSGIINSCAALTDSRGSISSKYGIKVCSYFVSQAKVHEQFEGLGLEQRGADRRRSSFLVTRNETFKRPNCTFFQRLSFLNIAINIIQKSCSRHIIVMWEFDFYHHIPPSQSDFFISQWSQLVTYR